MTAQPPLPGLRLEMIDLSNGHASAFELSSARPSYEVGGDAGRGGEQGYVHIGQARLPPVLLTCRVQHRDWIVRTGAQAIVTSGGQTIPANRDRPISSTLEIALSPQHRLRISRTETTLAAGPGPDATPAAQLLRIEHDMLTALIDFRERERGFFALPEGDQLERMSDRLDRHLSEAIKALPHAELRALATACVERSLIYRCIAGDSTRPLQPKYSTMPEQERKEYESILDDLLIRMEIDVTAGESKRSIEKIVDSVPELFKNYYLGISRWLLTLVVCDAIREQILNLFFGLGPLQALLDIEIISEIMVVRFDQVFVEKNNETFKSMLDFTSEAQLRVLVGKLLSQANLSVSEGEPYQDARLPDGSRVHVIIPPIALKGTSLTIRKFGNRQFTLDELAAQGQMSLAMRYFLGACVRAGKNIIVSGGTGSGKTTLLNALAMEIPADERIVTIEDTAELRIDQPHVVTLQSKSPSPDGHGEVTIRDLVANALRMRPDRLIVGECRRGEALDMLQAMNTGHDGSMTTAHANSPRHLMGRLENMALQADLDIPSQAIRQQIVGAIDLVVQIRRSGGRRLVTEIAEVVVLDQDTGEVVVEPIFRRVGGVDGRHELSGTTPGFLADLIAEGGLDLNSFLAPPGAGAA